MSIDRRLKALESSRKFRRGGKSYDMSLLSDEQLLLLERTMRSGAEIDGTTYLHVDDLTDHELVELEASLRLIGALGNREQMK